MSLDAKAWQDFRTAVVDAIDKEAFYQEHLGKIVVTGNDIKGSCPFHQDKTPSFHAFRDSGRFKCFGCDKEGSIFDFLAFKTGVPFSESIYMFAKQYGVPLPAGAKPRDGSDSNQSKSPQHSGTSASPPPPKKTKPKKERTPISQQLIDQWHDILINDPARMKYLLEERCLELDTIKRFKIGYNGNRYTIPIKNEKGEYWNVRLYSPGVKIAKILNYTYGSGDDKVSYGTPARLYGCDELDRKGPIIWCEGEWDRMLLEQLGYIAVTGTHGCSTVRDDWGPFFQGRDVIICFDGDSVGQNAVMKSVVPFLKKMGVKSMKNLILCPLGSKTDKDVTDWVRKGGNPEQLQDSIDNQQAVTFEDADADSSLPDPVTLRSFIEVDKSSNDGKRIECDITIMGETTDTYFAPIHARVKDCPLMYKGKCCQMSRKIHKISVMDKEMIEACGSTDKHLQIMLRDRICEKGKPCTIEVLKRESVREFFCTQKVNRITRFRDDDGKIVQQVNSTNEELVEKKVYFVDRLGSRIRNGHYRVTGVIRPHPKTQRVTLLIDSMVPQDDDYQSFKLDEEIENLRAIENMDLGDYLDEISKYVTMIYERDEMTLCALLTAMSVLWLPFRGEMIRGWVVSAMIGDSGTGKSQITKRISDYAKVGDFFSGLTGSRTGLAYAMVDHKHRGWEIKVGRYVANTRKLLFADEIQKIPIEELQAIGQASDDGWMTVDRVRSGGYETMTRLCMCGNPPKGKTMSDYLYGCLTLPNVFPTMMMRRMDLAVFSANNDIKDAAVFRKMPATGKCKISAASLRAQIYWSWNLKEEQIVWEEGAEELCCTMDERLSDMFGAADYVPVVCPFDMRKTVARLSAAWAVLCCSHKDDFKRLFIKKEHVSALCDYLTTVYASKNCQLNMHSMVSRVASRREYSDQEIEDVYASIESERAVSGGGSALLDILAILMTVERRSDGKISETKNLSVRGLADTIGVDRNLADQKIGYLKKLGMLRVSGSRTLRVTPNFNTFMQGFMQGHMDVFECIYESSSDKDRQTVITQTIRTDNDNSGDDGDDDDDARDPEQLGFQEPLGTEQN